MKDDIHCDEISSLIDGEITEAKKKEEITKKINNDIKLKFEFLTLKLLKKTIKDKVSPAELSVKQKDELLQKIIFKQNRFTFLGKLSFIQSKRFITYSTIVVVFLAFALLIFNGPRLNTDTNIVLEGSLSQNMFIQAVDNFQNIISGKMPIQMYSNNPKELQEFFKTNGVTYPTKIALLENSDLVGGFVSKYNGVIFAHHIYKDKNGNFLYMFQVDQKYFKENPKIFITNDLYQYLQNGNQYRLYLGNLLTIMTKVRNNICALISNLPEEKLPEKYKLKFATTYYKQPSILNN
ncbi:MAG: hypothetical protein IIA48_02190 [Bacteroidetes bacterium]|nr:hypothetical protein [Bacteroidota bacterium]MCH8941241.1 hypothetical protein [Bacteroidota bacterium]